MRYFILLLLFTAAIAQASLRIIDADQIRSSNRASVWLLPNISDSIVGASVAQALSNKSIDGNANTITNVPGSALAAMANSTVKGNVSGSSATPSDLTAGQITAMITTFTGDSGTGAGQFGKVPAPAAGDTGLGKFLHAGGTWSVPPTPTADHGALTGLTDDDHSQYALLAGRTVGQVLMGGLNSGGSLVFLSNPMSNGKVYLGTTAFPAAVDQSTGYFGIGTSSPSSLLHVKNINDSYTETLCLSNGSSNLYCPYVSPGSTFILRNHTQTLSYLQALSTGQISLGGASAAVGKGLYIQNHAGKTTDVTVHQAAIASQTANLHEWANPANTVMAKIDVNGNASVQNLSAGNLIGSGSTLMLATAGGSVEKASSVQAAALISTLTGDSGSGGVNGLVPAPSAGDAAAGKFLKADATWAVPTSGAGAGDSVWFVGANVTSNGSTNTKIRNFAKKATGGTSITGSIDSTALGSYIQINTTGYYYIEYLDNNAGSTCEMGISRNSSSLTTNIRSIHEDQRLANGAMAATDRPVMISYFGPFNSGDSVRAHGDGNCTATANGDVYLKITRIF